MRGGSLDAWWAPGCVVGPLMRGGSWRGQFLDFFSIFGILEEQDLHTHHRLTRSGLETVPDGSGQGEKPWVRRGGSSSPSDGPNIEKYPRTFSNWKIGKSENSENSEEKKTR